MKTLLHPLFPYFCIAAAVVITATGGSQQLADLLAGGGLTAFGARHGAGGEG